MTSHMCIVRVKIESKISAWEIRRLVIHSFIQQTLNDYYISGTTVARPGGVAVIKIDKNTCALGELFNINKDKGKCIVCQI